MVEWDEALHSGLSILPDRFTWDAQPLRCPMKMGTGFQYQENPRYYNFVRDHTLPRRKKTGQRLYHTASFKDLLFFTYFALRVKGMQK